MKRSIVFGLILAMAFVFSISTVYAQSQETPSNPGQWHCPRMVQTAQGQWVCPRWQSDGKGGWVCPGPGAGRGCGRMAPRNCPYFNNGTQQQTQQQ